MKRESILIWAILFSLYLFTFYCGGPTTAECEKEADCPQGQTCTDGKCSPISSGEKKADERPDKSDKSDLERKTPESTDDNGEKTNQPDETAQIDESQTDETAQTDEGSVEPSAEIPDELHDGTEPTEETEPTADGEPTAEKSGCSPPSFLWNGQCTTPKEFCTTKFPSSQQVHIKQPYSVVFDGNGTPLFCQTNPGSYYDNKSGYKFCDRDGDGWITVGAYRAMNSPQKTIRDNARCQLRKVEAVVYHPDNPNAKPQIQFLKTPLPLIETERNDGLAKNTDLPVYPEYSQSLPKTPSTTCTADTDCNSAQGELCYLGQCVKGRRFKPTELNSLTKACVKNIDLNDNLVDDPSETPNSTVKPTELSPLLPFGYFVELNYGYYQKDYNIGGRKIPVYHIVERSRRKSPAKRGLALLCGEDSKGKKPDYWKFCYLKDDQRCSSSGSTGKNGLSHCWMDKVEHATRSLFKCAVFDGKKDSNTYFFHPHNFGLQKKYTRSTCRLKGSLSSPSSSKGEGDVQFECKLEKNPPDDKQTQVGWACVSFHPYKKPDDYLAGCIDECAESKKLPGAAQPCGANEVCTPESGSYGRGRFRCDTGGTGACRYNQNYCSWGKWTQCPPRNPSTEICDGMDNDCDGFIDEDPKDNKKMLSRQCYTGKTGCVRQPDGTYKCNGICKAGSQVCFSGKWENKCVDEALPKAEACNGKDDDCDGKVDEDWPVNQNCYAGQLHCRDTGKWLCKPDGSGVFCTAKDKAKPETCNGKDDDCDGRVDENCPYAVYTTAVTYSNSISKTLKIGNTGTSSDPHCSDFQCPPGTVVTGVQVALGGAPWVRMIGYTCSEVHVGGFLPPNNYKLEFKNTVTFYCKSKNFRPTPSQVASCPQGHVLVGFSGRTGASVDQLTIWCSRAMVYRSSKGFQILISQPNKYRTIGGNGGSPFSLQKCPPATAVTGLKIFYSDKNRSEIKGFTAECRGLGIVGAREYGNNPYYLNKTCNSSQCPRGIVMKGIKIKTGRLFSSSKRIRSITSICSEINLFEDRRTTPFSYLLQFREKMSGECSESNCCFSRGEVRCPSGYVLVGFSGRADKSYLYQLTLWCRKIEVKKYQNDYQITFSASKKYGAVGFTRGTAFQEKLCPSHSALSGLITFYNLFGKISGLTGFCNRIYLKKKR